MPSEKELDRALALELETNSEFLSWLISHTKFAGEDVKFHSCRADHPWGSHPFTSSDLAADETTTVTRQSETDVLLVISDENGRKLGIGEKGSGSFLWENGVRFIPLSGHLVKKMNPEPIPGKTSLYVCRESALLVAKGVKTVVLVNNKPIGTLKANSFVLPSSSLGSTACCYGTMA